MDDYALSPFDTLPEEVKRLVSKPGPLDAGEARLLENYLVTNGATLDPEMARMIGAKVGSAPTDWRAEVEGLTPSAAPSVPDQVNASLGDQVGGFLSNPPGARNLEGYEGAGPPEAARTTEDVTRADYTPPTTPSATMHGAAVNAGASGLAAGSITPPDQIQATILDQPTHPYTGNPRRLERDFNDLEDRRGGGDRPNNKPTSDLFANDPTSVFAGVGPDFSDVVAANPAIVARMLAESRGGGDATAAAMGPRVEGALALSRAGLLSHNKDLNVVPATGREQLQQAEDWLGQLEGNGVTVNPASVYQRALRRAKRTPPGEMSTGEGQQGSLQNQIAVTNGALALALKGSGATPEAQVGIANKLERASQDYVMGLAKGDPDISAMSYPEYLRSIRAQKWLGR